jgi:hypothetical protein
VQCPEDTLAFVTPAGQQIPPDVIRYKLNMLSVRAACISQQLAGLEPAGTTDRKDNALSETRDLLGVLGCGPHFRHVAQLFSFWETKKLPGDCARPDTVSNALRRCHDGKKLMLGKQPPLLNGIFQRPSLPSGAPATNAQVRSTILAGRSGIMPPFQNVLSGQDISDIIEYLHIGK